jgi:type II secretory pathway pseudopilin PulG
MRRGFTLVETLVALLLLQIGVLAVVAASAVAVRDLSVARRTDRAHALARNRLELLAAAPCPSIGTFTLGHPGGFVEHWRVDAVGSHRRITDSVAFALPRGRLGHVVLRGATLCDG